MERVKPEIRSELNKNLKGLIEKAGNVTAFAESIGVSRDTVNNWLLGKSDIRLNDLVKISQEYNISVDFLLGLDESPTKGGDKLKAEKYTGLSAAAVEVLHEDLRDNGDIVSALIASPPFTDYIYQIERLESKIDSCQQEINIVHDNGISDNSPVSFEMLNDPGFRNEFEKREKGSSAVSRLYTELALLQVGLFELSRLHSSIIEAAFPNEKTISDGRIILKQCGITL